MSVLDARKAQQPSSTSRTADAAYIAFPSSSSGLHQGVVRERRCCAESNSEVKRVGEARFEAPSVRFLHYDTNACSEVGCRGYFLFRRSSVY